MNDRSENRRKLVADVIRGDGAAFDRIGGLSEHEFWFVDDNGPRATEGLPEILLGVLCTAPSGYCPNNGHQFVGKRCYIRDDQSIPS